VQVGLATVSFIRQAHREGREVHVWNLKTEREIRQFLDRGPDNLITDFPRVAREVLDARSPTDELRAAVIRLFR
ncbi:MAG: glycerophosphodiester phosphodiesterase family protein, partial [Planctomycetota bacterium]|jgi:glycerophosphoryl diester phosphodiesterase